MTPKEKAEELISKMLPWMLHDNIIYRNAAKQCALIAVDEILPINSNPQAIKFWEEVKQEIQAL